MRSVAANWVGAIDWSGTMHRAVTVSARVDLRPLVAILRERGVDHQITEESGTLVVWACSEVEAEVIERCYQAWQQGQLVANRVPAESGSRDLLPLKGLLQGLISAVWIAPVSVILICACLAVAMISDLGADIQSVRGLFFPDYGRGEALLSEPLHWIRMLTPALLHFGPIHLVFNMLWLWFFGRMMEPLLKSGPYLLIILWLAFAGNVAQYLWSGVPNFGGMSGVVYGQIGFIWIWHRLRPQSSLRLPRSMIMVFLVALVLMEVLASSYIATAAHTGGLVAGMAAALLMGFWYQMRASHDR
jgi:GlpG protein